MTPQRGDRVRILGGDSGLAVGVMFTVDATRFVGHVYGGTEGRLVGPVAGLESWLLVAVDTLDVAWHPDITPDARAGVVELYCPVPSGAIEPVR